MLSMTHSFSSPSPTTSFRTQPLAKAGALVWSRSLLKASFPHYRGLFYGADNNSTCDSNSNFLLTTNWRVFFSATIGLSLSFAIMLLVPGVPAISRIMLAMPSHALANAMACRVYRAVKLGLIEDPISTWPLKTLQFNSAPSQPGHEPSFERPTFGESLVDITNLGINAGHTSTLPEDSETFYY